VIDVLRNAPTASGRNIARKSPKNVIYVSDRIWRVKWNVNWGERGVNWTKSGLFQPKVCPFCNKNRIFAISAVRDHFSSLSLSWLWVKIVLFRDFPNHMFDSLNQKLQIVGSRAMWMQWMGFIGANSPHFFGLPPHSPPTPHTHSHRLILKCVVRLDLTSD